MGGEHDFCLFFSSEEDGRVAGLLGLPLDAEAGLLGIITLRFSGALWDKESISEGFDGLLFTVGEVPRDGTELLDIVDPIFLPDEDRSKAGKTDVVDLRVGVVGLGADFKMTGIEGLGVGVEERGMGLVGVEDLDWAATGFEEDNVALEVGVEGREGFVFAGKAGLLVGVAALGVGFLPRDDEGLVFSMALVGCNEFSEMEEDSPEVFSVCTEQSK